MDVGGINKSYSDVATDFTFSVITDKIKGLDLPNTKISGNQLVKSTKNGILDFISDETKNSDIRP